MKRIPVRYCPHLVAAGYDLSDVGESFLVALAAGNSVPAHQFPYVEAVNVCQRVQPVNAWNGVLHFEIVQAAGGKDESVIPMLPCQSQTQKMNVPQCQSKCPASGS